MDQLKEERRHWLIAVLFTSVLAWLSVCLMSSCTAKKAAQLHPKTIVVIDTTRVKLMHRVDTARQAVLIIHERNKKSLQDYATSAAEFDSIVVDLP